MKKFLALVFALIFALSACTVAFAADYECTVCHAILADQKALDEHNNGGCLEQFRDCQYCGAKVLKDSLADHEADCPKGACACDYCGEDFATKGEYDAHLETCKAENNNIPVASIMDKIVEAVKGIDWADLANKVVEAVKGIDFEGIIAKIKPIIEKVVALVEGVAA